LDIADYSFTYEGVSSPALSNVNLKIEYGEIAILAGPSGCGKTTLLRSVIGLIPHMYAGKRSGQVIVDGIDVSMSTVKDLAKSVGYVFQNPENQIFMFSVERDVAFGLENLGVSPREIRERVNWAMQLVGIEHLANRAPHELSDGQRQRVALAGVLSMKPKILILDEPTSLLDPTTAIELISTLKRLNESLNITVIVVEHRLELLLQIATKLVIMSSGRIIHCGHPREVIMQDDLPSLGIGVPAVTKLHRMLNPNSRAAPLTVDELIESVGLKSR